MMQVQIPKGFFNDHVDRDLPTPAVISETKRHYVIDTQDPAFAELVDDAEYYAGNGNDAPLWLKSAAAALLRALTVSTHQ